MTPHTPPSQSSRGPGVRVATAAYAGLAIVMTWPLVLGLDRDVAPDLGDSLLNSWILGWNATRLIRLLGGDFGALDGWWDANIFHPEPLTLAYSEHLFAQSLQIVPVFGLTGNVILCYNLLVLSTFVLSALGMFLLVRDLTGSPRAAFVAGLLFGFAPYRIAQLTHLQVLSAQWMPMTLFGLRRYFVTGRTRALVGAAAAWVAQNLSCGYYLLFFAPFVGLYILYELATRRRLGDRRAWSAIATASVVVGLATWPFVSPYLALRQHGFEPRGLDEVRRYSADVYSYLTASALVHVNAAPLAAFPKPEGELYPTMGMIALAALGLASEGRRAWRGAAEVSVQARWRRWVGRGAAFATVLYAALTLVVLLGFGGRYGAGSVILSVRGLGRLAGTAVVFAAAWLLLLPRARAFVRELLAGPAGFFGLALALAVWLSFGPEIMARGVRVAPGPYGLLYDYLPGFDGLRVPARLGMLATMFGSVLAGFGADALLRAGRQGLLGAVTVLFFVEAVALPIPLNATAEESGLATPEARVLTGASVPPVYRFVRDLPADAVLVEFPFGAPGYELRYLFYSTEHWRRLVNGYSGGAPSSYQRRVAVLTDPGRHEEAAWRALGQAGATHVIVHEAAFLGKAADAVIAWLQRRGARRVARFDSDHVFELPSSRDP